MITTRRSLVRILGFTFLLYVIFDGLFIVVKPFDHLEHYSIYGSILPLQDRLFDFRTAAPNGVFEAVPLETAFRAHTISRPITADEFRVALLGDSGVLGTGDSSEGTISGLLTDKHVSISGKRIVVYNLGWPTSHLTKDLLIADYALPYQPDLFIWLINPLGMPDHPPEFMDDSGVIRANADQLAVIAAQTGLDTAHVRYYAQHPKPWWQYSLLFERDNIIAWLHYQMDGFDMPGAPYPPTALRDLTAVPIAANSYLADSQADAVRNSDDWKVLLTLSKMTSAPVLIVNEPIQIVPDGAPDAAVNYDSFFARAVYDTYRELYNDFCQHNSLWCLDLWNLVPANQYTTSPLHRTKQGNSIIADQLLAALTARYSGNRP